MAADSDESCSGRDRGEMPVVVYKFQTWQPVPTAESRCLSRRLDTLVLFPCIFLQLWSIYDTRFIRSSGTLGFKTSRSTGPILLWLQMVWLAIWCVIIARDMADENMYGLACLISTVQRKVLQVILSTTFLPNEGRVYADNSTIFLKYIGNINGLSTKFLPN